MLRKLIKHEWKATWRNLALFNGGIILLGILGRIMIPLVQNSRLTEIPLFAAASVICIFFLYFCHICSGDRYQCAFNCPFLSKHVYGRGLSDAHAACITCQPYYK